MFFLPQCFAHFDGKGAGALGAGELALLLRELGVGLDTDAEAEMAAALLVDGDIVDKGALLYTS